jgi:hypothetical protein
MRRSPQSDRLAEQQNGVELELSMVASKPSPSLGSLAAQVAPRRAVRPELTHVRRSLAGAADGAQ